MSIYRGTKTDVNTFESYYMHLHYLREDSLGSWTKTLILIKINVFVTNFHLINMLDCGVCIPDLFI